MSPPQAELGERLRLAGESAASPARLRSTLQSCLGVPLGGTPQPPPDANRQAYLLTVATAELARARHAPLQLDGGCSHRVPSRDACVQHQSYHERRVRQSLVSGRA